MSVFPDVNFLVATADRPGGAVACRPAT